jgi:hypothetical protein
MDRFNDIDHHDVIGLLRVYRLIFFHTVDIFRSMPPGVDVPEVFFEGCLNRLIHLSRPILKSSIVISLN